jgi:hypothetical protein
MAGGLAAWTRSHSTNDNFLLICSLGVSSSCLKELREL